MKFCLADALTRLLEVQAVVVLREVFDDRL
jgi:hypothetical protein